MQRMSVKRISATEARKRFGAVLREVETTGKPILIERRGRAVAVLLSVTAYEDSSRASKTEMDDRLTLARAAFGMWANRPDIDDLWLQRGRERWRSNWSDERAVVD